MQRSRVAGNISLKFPGPPRMVSGSLENGRVPEWSIGHAWKACVPLKGTEGSNPSPSAGFIISYLR